MQTILSCNVMWSFDDEVQNRDQANDLLFHVTGINPFHCHAGETYLTLTQLIIKGEDELVINLSNLNQLYLGFNRIYTATLTKNFGMFWKPLRLTLNHRQMVYRIIDYHMLGSKNKAWFNAIKELLT